jgi:hypothetical protein
MYLSYTSLGVLCAVFAVVWFWHDSLRVRDIANAAAMAACERIGLQFLDGTAAFSRLRFARSAGRLRLRRTYVFDYTSESIERRQGFAILLGHDVEYVGFAPEHTARPGPATGAATEPRFPTASSEIIDVPSNVLDLNEHRTRRAGTPDSRADVTPKGDRLN